jgi:hypothetical protein
MHGCERTEQPPQRLRPSGGAKSGKRKAREEVARFLAEGEMPVSVSGGGSSSSAPEFETTKKICFDLLLDKANNLESKQLGLAEELGLERSGAEKAKEIEVLEKKYQDVLDLNYEEHVEAQQEVSEYNKAHTSPIHQRTCTPLHPEDGRFDPTSCTSFDSS